MTFFLDLLKLSIRIFSTPIERVYTSAIEIDSHTLIYCFAHNINMLNPMIYSLKKHNIIKIHIIQNAYSVSGVETYEENMKKYNEHGIVTAYIPFNHDIIHTKNESDIVIDYARNNGYKNIILLAPTFHILRATMTMISSAIEKEADIKIQSIINDTSDWNELCSTHQGNTYATLNDTLELDLDRIFKYMEKGDIKRSSEIWEYLNKYG
jgi:hypothetical protein